MLQENLATGDSIRLVPGRYLDELGVAGSDDPSALGRTLGLRWLVIGSYALRDTPDGELLEVEVRLLDTDEAGGAETFSDSQPVEQLFQLVARVAARLRSHLEVGQLSPVELSLLEGSLPADFAAFQLYSEGLLALERHRPDLARSFLVRAIEAAPGYPLARIALADALDRLGHVQEAEREAQEAFRLAQGRLPRAEELRIEARYRELARQWDAAIEVWRALRTVFPDRREYVFDLAGALASAGRPADGMEVLEALEVPGAFLEQDPRLDLAEATARRMLGDFPGALRSAAAAEAKATAQGIPAVAVEASLERAFVLRESGELDEAEALYREAMTTLETWDDPGRVAEVMQELGVVASYRSDYEEARRLYEDALAVHRRLGDRLGAAVVLSSLGLTLAELGDLAEADRRTGEAVATLRRLGAIRPLSSALSNQGGFAQELGDLERAEALYSEAVRLARRTGSRKELAPVLNNLCDVHLARGHTAEAREAVAEAHRITREMESDLGRAITLVTLAAVDTEDLRLDAARRRLEEARSLAAASELEWLLGHVDEGLGRVAIEAGDLAEARDRLEAALARRQVLGEGREVPTSHCALADLALAEGAYAEAATRARSCLAGSRKLGKRDEAAEAGALLVEALVELGRLREAAEAEATWARPAGSSPVLAARVAAVRASALVAAARGERDRAIRDLRTLLETGDLGDGPARLRRRTDRLLRRLSAAAPTGSRGSEAAGGVFMTEPFRASCFPHDRQRRH